MSDNIFPECHPETELRWRTAATALGRTVLVISGCSWVLASLAHVGQSSLAWVSGQQGPSCPVHTLGSQLACALPLYCMSAGPSGHLHGSCLQQEAWMGSHFPSGLFLGLGSF